MVHGVAKSWTQLSDFHFHWQETQETWFRSLGWKDPLEKEMATHSSILAWRIPWTEEPVGLEAIGSISKHDCKKNYLNHLTICIIHYIYIYIHIQVSPVAQW